MEICQPAEEGETCGLAAEVALLRTKRDSLMAEGERLMDQVIGLKNRLLGGRADQ